MSQENVEIVRAAYETWNAGDVDALRELHDPDVIIVRTPEGWPEPGPFVGREAVMRQFEQLRDLQRVMVHEDTLSAAYASMAAAMGAEDARLFARLFDVKKGTGFLIAKRVLGEAFGLELRRLKPARVGA